MTLVSLCISTTIKKITMSATAPSQKTGISLDNNRIIYIGHLDNLFITMSLDNLCANDSW